MAWHPRNPALPLRATLFTDRGQALEDILLSGRQWTIPDAWVSLPANALKVLLELVRASDSITLTLGNLAARCGFSSASRLGGVWEQAILHTRRAQQIVNRASSIFSKARIQG